MWKDSNYLGRKVRPFLVWCIQHGQDVQVQSVQTLPDTATNRLTVSAEHLKIIREAQAATSQPKKTRVYEPHKITEEEYGADSYETLPMPTVHMQATPRPDPESDKLPAVSQEKEAVRLTFVRDGIKHFYCPIEVLLDMASHSYFNMYRARCNNPDDALPHRMKISWWNWIKACNKMLHVSYPIHIGWWLNNDTVICEGEA